MTNEQYKDLLKRIDEISLYLKIEEKRQSLREEDLRTQDPIFWDDPKKAEKQMKIIRGLKYWVENFDKYLEHDHIMYSRNTDTWGFSNVEIEFEII